MEIIKDKDLIWDVEKYDVILIGTSVYNMLSNGIQNKINIKYPELRDALWKTRYGDLGKIGTRVTCKTEGPTVSMLFICAYPNSRRVFLDYDGLKYALETAAAEFKGKRIATTVMGSSPYDGNGDRERIMEMMEEIFSGLDVTVYDYTQINKNKEIPIQIKRYMTLTKDMTRGEKKKFMTKDEYLRKCYLL